MFKVKTVIKSWKTINILMKPGASAEIVSFIKKNKLTTCRVLIKDLLFQSHNG